MYNKYFYYLFIFLQVRMQAQKTLRLKLKNEKDKDKNQAVVNKVVFEKNQYLNVFDALVKIVQSEGLLALYTGVLPTMLRAGV